MAGNNIFGVGVYMLGAEKDLLLNRLLMNFTLLKMRVVDWAHCDFCHKWVHLQPCCDSRCVQPDNRFKCIVCIKQQNDEELEKIMNIEINNEIGATMCIQEDETFYLLNESENQNIVDTVQLISNDDPQKILSAEVDNIL